MVTWFTVVSCCVGLGPVDPDVGGSGSWRPPIDATIPKSASSMVHWSWVVLLWLPELTELEVLELLPRE